ncbi:MAG: hypothetical protein IH623_24945 [Verrucomicrobia bacterium]|nr:hypothetical protein [Verrucomicrobiota bacterium]
MASFSLSRLPQYYSQDILTKEKVVVVPKVPVPPLSTMGLDRFSDFERMGAGGITYLDTYFVRADHAHIEALHFHELVHVIQWRLLGPERFLAIYADGLERCVVHWRRRLTASRRNSSPSLNHSTWRPFAHRCTPPLTTTLAKPPTIQTPCPCEKLPRPMA